MYKKTLSLKLFSAIFFVLAALECIYLAAFPAVLNFIADKEFTRDFINSKFNADIKYSALKFKTHIIPSVSAECDYIVISDENNEPVLNTDKFKVKISLLPLLFKRLNLKELTAQNFCLNLKINPDGSFNIEKIFAFGNKKFLKYNLKNTNININRYKILAYDSGIKQNLSLTGQPLILKFDKKGNSFKLVTEGILSDSVSTGGFDINIGLKTPFSLKNMNENFINGSCSVYNFNLKSLLPFLQKHVDLKISDINGIIDYMLISAEKKENNGEIVINTLFHDVLFNKTDWKNNINAKGSAKVNITAELGQSGINVKTFGYKSDNIDIKARGSIDLKDKLPSIDIETEIKNSRTEDIAALLPPELTSQYMTIEKIKTYGLYGDIEGRLHFKGKIPQPDITGYIKGRNIHILDKPLHRLHKGTVNITFDKRILNMDILIEMLNSQKAMIKGYVYMFRDGLNNVDIKTTGSIDFPLAQKLVLPVSKVFNFQLGPLPDMDIKSGRGIIDVNVQGSVDILKINGFSSFQDAKLSYNGLYGEVTEGKGSLDFKDDIIKLKTEKAFVKNNSLNIEGSVKINDKLDFNISSNGASSSDIIEIINKSSLLKDVKEGLCILSNASGITDLFIRITSNITPVPYGQPPLPTEEAFYNMKVEGNADLHENTCNIEGFKTPLEKINGNVSFTEELVNLNDITGTAGNSPITLNGNILTDLETKTPDVDITIKSDNVNLGDTIRFLADSYLYPENYPDLSPLYTIASKHDLYFKYKAKSKDFVTDKAYAVMNFKKDGGLGVLKALEGRVILDKSTVKIENALANILGSNFNINGHVDRVDTLNPIYNLNLKTDGFDLSNLDKSGGLSEIPEKLRDILSKFNNYGGFAKINASIKNNIPEGNFEFHNAAFNYIRKNLPINFDDFNVILKGDKIHIENMTALAGGIPLYADITVSDIYKNPHAAGYFTSKLSNEFINAYFLSDFADKIKITGDINLSAKFDGTSENFNIHPKLTLNPYADITVDNNSLGEITDKREFTGDINIKPDTINIKNLSYLKYISSQNNRVYPIIFASAEALLSRNKDNIIEAEAINIKTDRNISARLLNLLLKKPLFGQGALNFDLKYTVDKITKTAKLSGKMDCRNLDIPLFDTVIKNIKLTADNDTVDINVFGFISDSKIHINSILKNALNSRPEVISLKIDAEAVDNDKLLQTLSKTRSAMNENNQIKNLDLKGLKISNGLMNIKNLTVKSLKTSDFTSSFSIDENGIFNADNMSADVGQGNISGKIIYNLNTSDLDGDFTLKDVDANYAAETLFEGKNQIYGSANGKMLLKTKGVSDIERISNLEGFVYFDINDGRMPKLGSLEYLLRAGNIVKSGITGFTINNILELLNLVKSGYFSNINGSCTINKGIAENIEIFSKGDNMSLYMHGTYDISKTSADMEILGKISKQISTIFGVIGNTSINTFFKLIPGISLLDFSRKNFVEDVEKIPPFTGGYYDSRTFQAVINGNINGSGYVQSFKWVQ